MNKDPHECELGMDELDLVVGGQAVMSSTQHAGLVGRERALGRQGVVDDSV